MSTRTIVPRQSLRWMHGLSLLLIGLTAGKLLHQTERVAPVKDADGRQG